MPPREEAPRDQEVYDSTLQTELAKGTDRRVAEGRALAAGVRAYRAKHGEPAPAPAPRAPAAAAAGDGGAAAPAPAAATAASAPAAAAAAAPSGAVTYAPPPAVATRTAPPPTGRVPTPKPAAPDKQNAAVDESVGAAGFPASRRTS